MLCKIKVAAFPMFKDVYTWLATDPHQKRQTSGVIMRQAIRSTRFGRTAQKELLKVFESGFLLHTINLIADNLDLAGILESLPASVLSREEHHHQMEMCVSTSVNYHAVIVDKAVLANFRLLIIVCICLVVTSFLALMREFYADRLRKARRSKNNRLKIRFRRPCRWRQVDVKLNNGLPRVVGKLAISFSKTNKKNSMSPVSSDHWLNRVWMCCQLRKHKSIQVVWFSYFNYLGLPFNRSCLSSNWMKLLSSSRISSVLIMTSLDFLFNHSSWRLCYFLRAVSQAHKPVWVLSLTFYHNLVCLTKRLISQEISRGLQRSMSIFFLSLKGKCNHRLLVLNKIDLVS